MGFLIMKKLVVVAATILIYFESCYGGYAASGSYNSSSYNSSNNSYASNSTNSSNPSNSTNDAPVSFSEIVYVKACILLSYPSAQSYNTMYPQTGGAYAAGGGLGGYPQGGKDKSSYYANVPELHACKDFLVTAGKCINVTDKDFAPLSRASFNFIVFGYPTKQCYLYYEFSCSGSGVYNILRDPNYGSGDNPAFADVRVPASLNTGYGYNPNTPYYVEHFKSYVCFL